MQLTSSLKKKSPVKIVRKAILFCSLSAISLGVQAQITINNNSTLTALSMGYNGYNPPAQLRYSPAGVVTGWAVSASTPLLAPTSTGGTYGYNLPFPTSTTTVNATYTSYGDATINAYNATGLVASKAITIYPRNIEVPGSISYSSGNVSGSKSFTAGGNRWVNAASYYSWGLNSFNADDYTIAGSGATAILTPQPWAPLDQYVAVLCYFVPNGAPFNSSDGYLPYGSSPSGTLLREPRITSSNPNNVICTGTPTILTVDVDDNPNTGTYIPGGTSTAT
ncbi:hypothetical protein [Taibaiella koreensis]|uniref:hypothetical protein n=1 Tax=Taibaiella koreensis TaxID=1268548 RepID=UPI0013C2BE48|nr:hypothetical protein [Taibaiella koreensis]